jgi:VWFA-related protein
VSATQERQLLVTVLDKEDVPVTDLASTDLSVYEDGAARPVTGVERAVDPLAVVVLIDTGKSPIGTVEPTRDLRTAVTTFVETVWAGGAPVEMAIMEYAGAGTMLRGYTQKVEELTRVASRLVPSQRSNSVLLETLPDAARDLGKRKAMRRAIVVLDRGSLETSRVEQERVLSAIAASGASIWGVTVQSAQASSPVKEVVLDELTQDTGGRRFSAVSPAALEGLMKKVADALVSQYVVTYTSGGGTPRSIVPAGTKGARYLRAPVIR